MHYALQTYLGFIKQPPPHPTPLSRFTFSHIFPNPHNLQIVGGTAATANHTFITL